MFTSTMPTWPGGQLHQQPLAAVVRPDADALARREAMVAARSPAGRTAGRAARVREARCPGGARPAPSCSGSGARRPGSGIRWCPSISGTSVRPVVWLWLRVMAVSRSVGGVATFGVAVVAAVAGRPAAARLHPAQRRARAAGRRRGGSRCALQPDLEADRRIVLRARQVAIERAGLDPGPAGVRVDPGPIGEQRASAASRGNLGSSFRTSATRSQRTPSSSLSTASDCPGRRSAGPHIPPDPRTRRMAKARERAQDRPCERHAIQRRRPRPPPASPAPREATTVAARHRASRKARPSAPGLSPGAQRRLLGRPDPIPPAAGWSGSAAPPGCGMKALSEARPQLGCAARSESARSSAPRCPWR